MRRARRQRIERMRLGRSERIFVRQQIRERQDAKPGAGLF
jgi:hypothetical protein